jgi:hypothetical protein
LTCSTALSSSCRASPNAIICPAATRRPPYRRYDGRTAAPPRRGRLTPDDDHRHLLADLRQGGHQLPLGLGFTRPQLLVAQVQLLEFEIHRALVLRPAAPGRPLDAAEREPGPAPDPPPAMRRAPWGRLAHLAPAEIAPAAPRVGRRGVESLLGSLAWLIPWSRRRVSAGPRPRGTPMRHLPLRLAHEVLLLPAFVIERPRRALLVLRARPLHPLAPSHRRAPRVVNVAAVTGAADAHRAPASYAREHPRLGRRHRAGVPRALHFPRRARCSSRLAGRSITPPRPVTRRSGCQPGSPPAGLPPCLPHPPGPRQSGPVTSGGSLLTSTPLGFSRASKREQGEGWPQARARVP